MSQLHLSPLRHFLAEFTRLVAEPHAESTRLELGTGLLRELIADDSWLAPEFAQPHPEYYQQYLLYADPLSRFSVVSFVWGPGQKTPIHDHRVWGLIGMLRGAESSQTFVIESNGELRAQGEPVVLQPGDVEQLSPLTNDIHQVSNRYSDQVSISIHVYGANIGAVSRAVYTPDGQQKHFISGYSNLHLPNIWDLSKESAHA